MAVTYDKISYYRIEQGLKDVINDDFPNVYVSPRFVDAGNEFIRINLNSSTNLQSTNNFEDREYEVVVRYYFKGDISNEQQNESVKAKIDRLKKKLLDSQWKESIPDRLNARWDALQVDTIEYDIQDDENAEIPDLYIAELMLSIIYTYTFI